MKKWRIAVGIILIAIICCYFFINEESKSETIVISTNNDTITQNVENKVIQPEIPLDYDDIDENNVINNKRFNFVIDWLDNNTILSVYGIIDYRSEDSMLNRRIVFKKYQTNGDELIETNQFSVDVQIDEYNENLTSHYIDINLQKSRSPYYDIKCLIKISPDKKSMLISIEDLIANQVNENVKVTNKGLNYIYDFNSKELSKIPDDARYVSWSTDSKSLYGSNYILTYNGTTTGHSNNTLSEHMFNGNIYKHNKYSIDNNVVETIVALPDVLDNCYISKRLYDDVLNKKHVLTKAETSNTFYRSRAVYSIINIHISRDYVIKSGKVLGLINDKYVFANEQSEVLVLSKTDNSIISPKDSQTHYLIGIDKLVNTNLIISNGINDSTRTISSINIEANQVKHLYYGDVWQMAYSEKSNKLAFYDRDKNELLIADFKDGELTNIKSYFEGTGYVADIIFSMEENKLYLKSFIPGASKATSVIIDIDNEKVIEANGLY